MLIIHNARASYAISQKEEIREYFFQECRKQKEKFAHDGTHSAMQKNIVEFFQKNNVLKGTRVLLYDPYPSEVPILKIFQQSSYLSGMEIYIPYIKMDKFFAQKWNATEMVPPNASTLDYVFAPGLFADFRGVRIGRGGGWYDKVLSYFPTQKIIFLCYHWQYWNNKTLPKEEHDESVGYAITEKETIEIVDSVTEGGKS